MKSEEYKSYYNLLSIPSYSKSNDKNYAKYRDEFWESYNLEKGNLSPEKIDQFGFVLVFKNLNEEKKIQSFLEDLFSSYDGDSSAWLHYTLNWITDKKKNFKGWQIIIIEKWLTDKIDIYSKMHEVKKQVKETDSLMLTDMFSNPDDLQRITNQLTKKSFVKNGTWQGKPDPVTARNPKEKLLAALALVIVERDFLKKKHYQAKQMHEAFNTYFKVKTSGYFFKPGQLAQIEDSKKHFYFI